VLTAFDIGSVAGQLLNHRKRLLTGRAAMVADPVQWVFPV
jgi:hypothetical protein